MNHFMQREIREVEHPSEFGKVAVLYGGISAEREVSLMSGKAVYEGLLAKGVDAVLVDYAEIYPYHLVEMGIDRVWIALHGRGGEDGSLQGALEQLNIPYTGSGVLGSALCLDKVRSKQIFKAAGIRTPNWKNLSLGDSYDVADVLVDMTFPLVVKPALEGSSIGMSIISSPDQFDAALQIAFDADKEIIIEEFISGREITSAVLHNEALPLIYIQPENFYDYQAKYHSKKTQYHCPSGLEKSIETDIQKITQVAFSS